MSARRTAAPRRLLALVVTFAAAALVVAPRARADSATKCVTDGSVSTKVCFTITWTSLESGGYRYASVSSVGASVSKLDPTASVLNLRVGAVVFGKCYSGCGLENAGKLLANRTPPTLGHRYAGTPPWSNVFTRLDGPLEFSCVVVGVEWAIHGHSMTYTADYCVGHQPNYLSNSQREPGLR